MKNYNQMGANLSQQLFFIKQQKNANLMQELMRKMTGIMKTQSGTFDIRAYNKDMMNFMAQ